MAKKIERNSLGMFSSPYPEKRSQARGIRLPPDIDTWLVSEQAKRGCTFNDLIIEATRLLREKAVD